MVSQVRHYSLRYQVVSLLAIPQFRVRRLCVEGKGGEMDLILSLDFQRPDLTKSVRSGQCRKYSQREQQLVFKCDGQFREEVENAREC